MASNIFARYIWLIDTIRHNKSMSYKQINEKWKNSDLSYGDDLPKRTFHNHIQAIEEIFDVNIQCDRKHGNKYYISYIDYLEKDGLRSCLINSYATLNQLHANEKLVSKIQFEYIPSGEHFLSQILEAIRKSNVVYITYKGFGKKQANSFDIEPYFLKVFHCRWYVIARSPNYDKVFIYCLDRIQDLKIQNTSFTLPKNFNIDDYFNGCFGIIINEDIPIEKVVVKTYGSASDYVLSLPIHSSQKEIARDEDSITFEYTIRPTFDFFQVILSQLDQIEVIKPLWVREEIINIAKNILKRYENKKDE